MIEQKWLRLDGGDGWQIVIPDADIRPHGFPRGKRKAELAGRDCPCKPEINWNDRVVVHNSFRDTDIINESLKKHFAI